MGPNGSGKSTLSYALAGHPNYEVTGRLGDPRWGGLAGPGRRRARQARALPGLPVPDVNPGRHRRELPPSRRDQRPQCRPQGGGGPRADA
ncbi:MAG: hypothetical protein U0800_04765 [Isosphaeraceae bacterium]